MSHYKNKLFGVLVFSFVFSVLIFVIALYLNKRQKTSSRAQVSIVDEQSCLVAGGTVVGDSTLCPPDHEAIPIKVSSVSSSAANSQTGIAYCCKPLIFFPTEPVMTQEPTKSDDTPSPTITEEPPPDPTPTFTPIPTPEEPPASPEPSPTRVLSATPPPSLNSPTPGDGGPNDCRIPDFVVTTEINSCINCVQ